MKPFLKPILPTNPYWVEKKLKVAKIENCLFFKLLLMVNLMFLGNKMLGKMITPCHSSKLPLHSIFQKVTLF